MSERKVLNKYYPPDFDPSKIPRMKLPKNRQYTVRLMAPFNMRCATCGEYIYKGKKFNARKEDVENEDYLGIRIYRFYIKCTRCLQEISFKTDPKNTDYEIEAGATRNFMALKLAEEQALREEEEAKEEEASNPMKLLENRTQQSKNEIELLESLEELKDLNRRQEAVDYDSMLLAYDNRLSEREREEKLKQMDEDYIKTIKFNTGQKRKLVVEEEIIEEIDDDESPQKSSKPTSEGSVSTSTSDTSRGKILSATSILSTVSPLANLRSDLKKSSATQSWNKSLGSFAKKGSLKGLVKINKPGQNKNNERTTSIQERKTSASETSTSKTSASETTSETTTSGSKTSETTTSGSKTSETTSQSPQTQALTREIKSSLNEPVQEKSIPKIAPTNSLLLLGAYSDSDNSD